MEYRECCGEKLSALGFGTMRLPLLPGGDSSKIDARQVDMMVDYAIENGVNYFDTAFPYHGGMSEKVIAASLKRYPRDSYFLATKYPGHQISESYDPEKIFETQLKKCDADYFDFYLLHNLGEARTEYFDKFYRRVHLAEVGNYRLFQGTEKGRKNTASRIFQPRRDGAAAHFS